MKTEDVDLNRRSFVSGKLKEIATTKTVTPPRPPWVTESSLLDACSRCGDCITACPEKIIVHGNDQYPELDFTRSGCDYCGDCAASCQQEVFLPQQQRRPALAWQQRAVLNERCLNYNQVMCQSCQDSCQTEAIHFSYQDRIPRPVINLERCDGCGFCLSVCPTQAIDLLNPEDVAYEHL
ncbi:periplasmic nitrate reductase maturation protein NapF [Sinobacterium caligoides]|uniref:Periplasmic nitrate reductase maturation protein NapF n=1 Tax=Sinobacterium caligoides TaxID=933926 RepID=A0A3N2DPJ9_9GAMM|nr:ferredoxin-type protein NapF [Sinobacterium caligoides]ROS01559.1 periplasmic nitrate reductase maturation protein NapF [Sinobacterium caligoides]